MDDELNPGFVRKSYKGGKYLSSFVEYFLQRKRCLFYCYYIGAFLSFGDLLHLGFYQMMESLVRLVATLTNILNCSLCGI